MRPRLLTLLTLTCTLAASPSLRAATPATAPASSPPTAAELALVHAFDNAVRAADDAAAKNCIDTNALFDRAITGIDGAPKLAAMKGETASAISNSLVTSIQQLLHAGNTYTFIRIRTFAGKRTALFRLAGAGGLDYFDWEIAKSPDGSLRFADLFDLAKGDWISNTFHLYLLAGVASAVTSNDNLSPFQRDLMDSLPKIQTMNELLQDGKYKDALAAFYSLPVSVQELKPVLINRVLITDHLTPDEYDLALDAFEKRFPNDASLELLALDSFLNRKDYPRAQLAVDRMIAHTGGDGVLLAVKGTIFVRSGTPDDLAKAEDQFKKAIAFDPNTPKAYDGLIELYIAQKKFDKAIDTLNLTEKNLNIHLGDLSHEPGYADLVTTPEYAAWLKSRAAATQPAKP